MGGWRRGPARQTEGDSLTIQEMEQIDVVRNCLEAGLVAGAREELNKLKPGLRKRADALCLEARIFMTEENWEKALDLCERICWRYPQLPEAFIWRSRCLYELQRIEEAIQKLLEAPPEIRQRTVCKYNLACYELELGRFEEAAARLEESFAADPDFQIFALDDPKLEPYWQRRGKPTWDEVLWSLSPVEEIQTCAQKARLTAGEKTAYLCEPIIDCPKLGESKKFTPLCSWGCLNPAGPTLVDIRLVDVPQKSESLLFYYQQHFLTPKAIVFGLIPEQVRNEPDRLFSTLRVLFEQNGSHDQPLLDHLPTYVMVIPESPVSRESLEELLFLAAQDMTRRGMEMVPPSAEDSNARSESPLSSPSEFRRWWTKATDPDHVRSEMNQMQGVWDEAVKNFKGTAVHLIMNR